MNQLAERLYNFLKYFNIEVKQHISCFHTCLSGTVGSIAEFYNEKKIVSSLTLKTFKRNEYTDLALYSKDI